MTTDDPTTNGPQRSGSARRLLTLAVALLGAAALIGTGIAIAASHRAHHQLRAHAAGESATAYEVLSRPPTKADDENGAVQDAAEQEPRLDATAARVLEAGPNGRTWLIPTSDEQLCLGVQPAGQYEQLEAQRGLAHLTLGLACAGTEAADSDGIIVRIYDEVVGIVPDGVTTVTARVGSESPEQLTVTGNTYRLGVADGFQQGTVSFDEAGAERVDNF